MDGKTSPRPSALACVVLFVLLQLVFHWQLRARGEISLFFGAMTGYQGYRRGEGGSAYLPRLSTKGIVVCFYYLFIQQVYVLSVRSADGGRLH